MELVTNKLDKILLRKISKQLLEITEQRFKYKYVKRPC